MSVRYYLISLADIISLTIGVLVRKYSIRGAVVWPLSIVVSNIITDFVAVVISDSVAVESIIAVVSVVSVVSLILSIGINASIIGVFIHFVEVIINSCVSSWKRGEDRGEWWII